MTGRLVRSCVLGLILNAAIGIGCGTIIEEVDGPDAIGAIAIGDLLEGGIADPGMPAAGLMILHIGCRQVASIGA